MYIIEPFQSPIIPVLITSDSARAVANAAISHLKQFLNIHKKLVERRWSLLWCYSKSVGKLLPSFLGNIPEDSNLQQHCCAGLKSHTVGWNIANHNYSFHDISQVYLVCSIFLCTESEYNSVTHFFEHIWTCSKNLNWKNKRSVIVVWVHVWNADFILYKQKLSGAWRMCSL